MNNTKRRSLHEWMKGQMNELNKNIEIESVSWKHFDSCALVLTLGAITILQFLKQKSASHLTLRNSRVRCQISDVRWSDEILHMVCCEILSMFGTSVIPWQYIFLTLIKIQWWDVHFWQWNPVIVMLKSVLNLYSGSARCNYVGFWKALTAKILMVCSKFQLGLIEYKSHTHYISPQE